VNFLNYLEVKKKYEKEVVQEFEKLDTPRIIQKNVLEIFENIPATSPARTSFLKSISHGVTNTEISEIFKISIRTVSRARNSPHEFPLHVRPKITRDRITKKRPTLEKFFKKNTVVESGRQIPIFRGSKKSFFEKYIEFVKSRNEKPFSLKIFEKMRKKYRINIFSGDQFSDPRWIELRKLEQQRQQLVATSPLTREDASKVRELTIAIAPLLEHHKDANWMRNQCRKDIQDLKSNLENRVVYLDFTKWNQVTTGNVHSLVVVVCKGVQQPTGETIISRQNYDCLCQKTESLPVTQTFPYVKTALLDLENRGAFEQAKRVIIWSDGGPGHFKVYKTQRWMTEFQQKTPETLWEWNCFLPHRGHNPCDAHAGHAKKKVREQEKNYHLSHDIQDIVTALGQLSNTEVILLDGKTILNNDEPRVVAKGTKGFIREMFHFEYPALNELKCQHVKNKGTYLFFKFFRKFQER
jgi:hypothetical protein